MVLNAIPAASPILVITPNLEEAQAIAGWLRGAGLGAIATVRTGDEAIFMLGRDRPRLLIIDEAVPRREEGRLLRRIRPAGDGDSVPLVRMVGRGGQDLLAGDQAIAAGIIEKPLRAHDVVVRIGAVMQRPDLLGRLDQSLDQAAQHLEVARKMQIGLLPGAELLRNIRRDCGIGVAALYRSGEELGGDFWGAWSIGRGRLALALADFTGHGLSAAFNTFRLHALLSDEAMPRGQPTRMMALLNERLHVLLPRGQYASMVYMEIDPRRRLVTWCGAGGPPPLVVTVDRTDELEARGVPLGVKPDTLYRRRWMRLPDAGVLAVFSDGLFESGGRDMDVPRVALAGALARPARLAVSGDLTAAAQEGAARLEALRDLYPCPGHSDDVMAVCVAFGPGKT